MVDNMIKKMPSKKAALKILRDAKDLLELFTPTIEEMSFWDNEIVEAHNTSIAHIRDCISDIKLDRHV